MKHLTLVVTFAVLSVLGTLAQANRPQPPAQDVEIDSLTPQNQNYLNAFCNFHPASSLCHFTPNPVAKPPLNTGGPIDPTDPVTPTGPIILPIVTDRCVPDLQCSKVVHNAAQLAAEIASLDCGCELVVKDGTYAGNHAINKSCSADNPAIIRSENPFGAKITGTFTLGGSNTIVEGFLFTGAVSGVKVGGTANRVIGNVFTGWGGTAAIIMSRGQQAEIAFNEITRPAPWGTGSKNHYGIATNEKSAADFHFAAYIHHNYIHDFPPKPGNYQSGQNDAIQMCETVRASTISMRSNWVVERNLIANHRQGYGVLDFKCSGATIRFNSLVDSPKSYLDLRQGHLGSLVQSNWIENAGGIGVYGLNNQVAGNVLRNTPGGIALIAGNVPGTSISTGDFPSATNTRVFCNNSNTMIVGRRYGSGHVPVSNTTIESHTGAIRYDNHTGTKTGNTSCSAIPAAQRLSTAQVGPAAAGLACKK